MRQLLLLRHAKSSWDDPQLSDHARPLNMRGRAAAAAMAVEVHRLGMQPDLVLVSSARRTLQTLAAMEPWPRPPRTEPLDALYLAPAADLLDGLRQVQTSAMSVLLVGHNPGLHELAVMLASEHSVSTDKDMRRLLNGYPSGTLTEFSVAVDWAELSPRGARLMRFIPPADVVARDVTSA